MVKSLNDFFGAFPDYTISVESITVDGNKAYVQNTFKGTHTGTLAGMIPATNKAVVWRDVDIIEFNIVGKMVAYWANNPNAVLDKIGYHALSNPNTAAVIEGYAQFGKGDVASIVAACTDDVVWNVITSPAPNVARIYKGKQELATFFSALSAGLQITKFEPYRFLADGDDVVAFINTKYKLTGNPKLYKAALIHHFVMRDGKIASFKEVMDKPQEISVATK